jgi:hypothetical protein
MADKRKAGLAFAQAFKQADAEATAALAAKKAERMAQLVESERALPLRLPRATPKTNQELAQHAERVGRQMLGEHVTSGKKGDTKNLAGRSMRENERIKALEYELAPTKDIPASTEYESRIGDINVAFPGDYTVSDVELKSLRGKPVGSKQQGGSRYGLGKMDRDDPLFWASSEMPAQLAQDKITDVAHLFEPDRVMAEHLAMGPVATNFAQHFADANLRAIDYSKLRKKDMKLFDDIIAGGYDKKNPKTGVIETVAFPNWPGIADPEMAYQAMKRDPELRKWFNSRMKTPKVTEATNMPNGLDVQWAITSPDLRNMEVNLTGHSVGEMVPSAKLTDTAEHETYAKGIRGKYAGHQGVLTPFSISYPDAAQHIASTQRPQDFTGTIQKVFPHQIVDQQYLDEYGEYKRQLDRIIRGKKKGGEVSKDSDYQSRLDAMLGKHMADGGGAFKKIQYKAAGGIAYKKMQFKAEGGGIDNEMPDVSDSGDIMFAPKYASGGAIHHGIKPLQWKAGGGWAKAGKAIQKAAKEAGAKTAPQTAEKDLTNIQDFHTSLMDTVRDRAIKAKQEMDSWDYKYDKGQRVFTDSSAKRNKAPYTIVERSRHGHNLMWEGEPWTSKKIIDPETGKAKRTPYEPAYKVRSENPETGEWQEFILPETAIRGDVEMAKGGLSKLSKAVSKASKEADAKLAKAIEAPSIIVPSKLGKVKDYVRQNEGEYGARRLERAADEIPNLEKMYQEDALKQAFAGDNAKAVMTLDPKDFEKYAMPLPMSLAKDRAYFKEGARNPTMREAFMASGLTNEQWHELTDVQKMDVFNAFNKKQSKMAINEPMEYEDYIKHLGQVEGGFNDVPFLQINKQEQGLPLTPFISGHEGRHRNRALAEKGESKGLVQLLPRAELREPFPRRSREEYIEALKKELEMTGNMVRPEAEDVYGNGQIQQIIRKPIQLPELYAEGGFTGEEGSTEDTPSKTRLMMEILARMAKEQAGEEVSSLKKPRAATDLLNRGVIAPLAGIPVDLINMGLEGVDAVRGLASGKPVENRLASDKPVLGSEYIMDLMRKYGMTTDTERPMMETALSVVSPSVGGAAKGVEKVGQAAKKGARAAESGLNATSAAMRRQYNARTKTN